MTAYPPKKDIADELREKIRSGQYLPNERLIEADLAAAFSTNRAIIRNVLMRLEQEGLVVREANRGARVRAISNEEAVEIIEVRKYLERLNAGRAAQRATEPDKKLLSGIVDRMRNALEREDLSEFSQLNGLLHQTVQTISGNRTAEKLLDTLLFPIVRLQFRSILLPGRAAEVLSEYKAVVDAVRANDAEAAMAAMDRHFDGVLSALRRAIALSVL